MSHHQDKYRLRENRSKVRALFLREWDLLGVSEIPEAADEYDTYAFKAYVMLMAEHATCETIAAYLYDIAANYIGLGENAAIHDRCIRTAALLAAMKPEFEASH